MRRVFGFNAFVLRNNRMYLFHLFDVFDRRLYWRKFVECYNKIELFEIRVSLLTEASRYLLILSLIC